MTCIVTRFKTKKEMKEYAALYGNFVIYDPSIFNERFFNASDLKDGEEIVVTNHPKRSWFARIRCKAGVLYIK